LQQLGPDGHIFNPGSDKGVEGMSEGATPLDLKEGTS